RGGAAGGAGLDAGARRVQLLGGVRDRTPLPRFDPDDDRRGHERRHADGDRPVAHRGQGQGRLVIARSWLFCPADRPDRLTRAVDVADVAVADLEDAVATDAKARARATGAEWLAGGPGRAPWGGGGGSKRRG